MEKSELELLVVPAVNVIISGLVELGMPRKAAPISAAILGAGITTGLAAFMGTSVVIAPLWGLVYGAAAIGLYSGAKNHNIVRRAPKAPPETSSQQ